MLDLKNFYKSLDKKERAIIKKADKIYKDYLDKIQAQKRLKNLKRQDLQPLSEVKKEILGCN